jgi:hypothetical protein
MARPFSLLEEFRQAAADLPRGGKTADDLLALYGRMPEEDRAQATQALYDCGMQFLKNFVPPKSGNWLGQVVPGNVASIFAALQKPDSLRHLSPSAAGEMADMAAQLLDRAQGLTTDEVSEFGIARFKNAMIDFARAALGASNAIRTAPAGDPAIAVNTSQSIRPLRPLVLKSGEPPAA